MFTRTHLALVLFGLFLLTFGLSGCAAINDRIPSFWDPNQSISVTNIQRTTRHLDCTADLKPQVTVLQNQIEWFQIYSETKNTKDVLKLSFTLSDTVKELADKANAGSVSPVYCNLKKKILIEQANTVADAVQWRF